jgi:glycerol kinase
MSFILALNQGTASSRALVFDHDGNVRGLAQKEFRQIFRQPGFVEHDAEERLADAIIAATCRSYIWPELIYSVAKYYRNKP